MGYMTSQLINKEEIPQYSIIKAVVDRTMEWTEKLTYATRLGNEFKAKTTISFQTTDGIKTVETTVWSATEKYISLKGGITIPLTSITDLQF